MSDASTKEKVGEVVSRAKRRFGIETPDAADADGRVAIVRGALRAFGEGEVDTFLDALSESIRWEAPNGRRFPGGGQHSGRDGIREQFVGAVKRTYTSFGFRPDSFLDVDDENAVVTIGRFVGEGIEGANVDVPGAQLWELKGNTVERICIFTDSAAFPEVATEEDVKERQAQEEEAEKDEESGEHSDEPQATKDDSDEHEERADADEPKAKQESDGGQDEKTD